MSSQLYETNLAIKVKIDQFHIESQRTSKNLILFEKRNKFLYKEGIKSQNNELGILMKEILENLNINSNKLKELLITLRINFSLDNHMINQLKENNIINLIINILINQEKNDDDIVYECSWILINFIAFLKDDLYFYFNNPFIDIIIKLIKSNNVLLKEHGIWCLGNIVGNDDKYFRNYLIDNNNIPILICNSFKYIDLNDELASILIWLIQNLVNGFSDKEDPKNLLNNQILTLLFDCMEDDEKSIKLIVLYSLKNISCSSSIQIQYILDDKSLFSKILMRSLLEIDLELKYEYITIICNISASGNLNQIKELVDAGILEVFSINLQEKNTYLIKKIIDSLDVIFNFGKIIQNNESYLENPYKKSFEELNGIQILLNLQKNHQFSYQIIKLLEEYFD